MPTSETPGIELALAPRAERGGPRPRLDERGARAVRCGTSEHGFGRAVVGWRHAEAVLP